MTSTLTRRGLVTAAPAAVVAASLPALAAGGLLSFEGTHPDCELLALREPYERTLAEIEAVSPAHSRAEEAFYALKAAHPDLDERTLRKRSGLTLAERAYVRALSRNGDVINLITETPARTPAGAAFKAQVSRRENNMNPDLVESLVEDLIAMGERNA